jgi:hypothetical protein
MPKPSGGGQASARPGLSVPCATLPDTGRRARYGVAYLRTICAQAGVGVKETSPDEDVLAVDCRGLQGGQRAGAGEVHEPPQADWEERQLGNQARVGSGMGHVTAPGVLRPRNRPRWHRRLARSPQRRRFTVPPPSGPD